MNLRDFFLPRKRVVDPSSPLPSPFTGANDGFYLEPIYAIRRFDLNRATGRLESLFNPYTWHPGENVSSCLGAMLRGDRKHRPSWQCACGFYAFTKPWEDVKQYPYSSAVGLIEAYGHVLVGTLGVRAEKAKIVALGHPYEQRGGLSLKAEEERGLLRASASQLYKVPLMSYTDMIKAMKEGKIHG